MDDRCWRNAWWSARSSIDRRAGDGAAGDEKNALKPWLQVCWCIPPKANADYVCAMEDVLEAYERDYGEDEVPSVHGRARADNRSGRAFPRRFPLQPVYRTAIYAYFYERLSNLVPLLVRAPDERRVDGALDVGGVAVWWTGLIALDRQ